MELEKLLEKEDLRGVHRIIKKLAGANKRISYSQITDDSGDNY